MHYLKTAVSVSTASQSKSSSFGDDKSYAEMSSEGEYTTFTILFHHLVLRVNMVHMSNSALVNRVIINFGFCEPISLLIS